LQKTHWWGQLAWGLKIGMMKGRGFDASSAMLDVRCWILDLGLWSLVAEIVNLKLDLLTHDFFLYSFCFTGIRQLASLNP
jgi:hypothetical protein